MNYTLHQLQVFLKVTQLKSITKAADELFLTQPAVSIQLKNFQDQFEIPLTEVIGRKLFVTDFGQEIALASENILNEVYAINYKTMAYKGQLFGRLKVAIVSTAKYIMPYFLSDFMNLHNEVELLLDVTNKSKVIESLEKNEIDFAMVSVLPTNLQIEKLDLMQNKLFLIGNSNHIFNDDLYDASIFENIPLIYREQGSGTRFVMEQFIKANNLPVHKKMELTTNEAVKQSVIAGLGYSIMPIIGIKNELENGQLKIIPVKNFPIISNWYLIWQKNKKFSPLAQAYLDFLKENKNQIVNDNFKWIQKF
jgi:LysR family transcriptional regulator, low CO2-responsive transcriptional regulator